MSIIDRPRDTEHSQKPPIQHTSGPVERLDERTLVVDGEVVTDPDYIVAPIETAELGDSGSASIPTVSEIIDEEVAEEMLHAAEAFPEDESASELPIDESAVTDPEIDADYTGVSRIGQKALSRFSFHEDNGLYSSGEFPSDPVNAYGDYDAVDKLTSAMELPPDASDKARTYEWIIQGAIQEANYAAAEGYIYPNQLEAIVKTIHGSYPVGEYVATVVLGDADIMSAKAELDYFLEKYTNHIPKHDVNDPPYLRQGDSDAPKYAPKRSTRAKGVKAASRVARPPVAYDPDAPVIPDNKSRAAGERDE